MSENKPRFIKCPDALAPLFKEAEETMNPFFEELERRPEEGKIFISGMRYLLMRSDSLAIELHEELRKTFGEMGARQIRYKLAKACGIRDAKMFHKKLNVEEPLKKLALGPIHFAHVGWAYVDIFPESKPEPTEEYLLIYAHPYSFEALSYLENGIQTNVPVCYMNAGYSTGWCEVSFGLDLKAEEITCRAKGDERCIFVMAHLKNFDRVLKECKQKFGIC